MKKSFEREALELAAILDTMADGVFVVDNDGHLIRWNRAMEKLTGYTAEEALGKTCRTLLRPDMQFEDCDGVGPYGPFVSGCDPYESGTVDNLETYVRTRDGEKVSVLASARLLYDHTNSVIGAVVTLKDISSIKRLEGEVDRLRRAIQDRHEFHNIIGHSAPMQQVFNLIELAADSQVTVLIQGETGTGKELVARAIHFNSERKNGPLVSVSCSALSESLLESELFGHVRGAFTGAIHERIGRFEQANGGTIFLDEIGEISPIVQVKLLRVLQEHQFERVGDSRTRTTDVRVICATHRNLRQLVREGLFREDLYYRLNVFPIYLPPLRERKEDVPLLLEAFRQRFCRETGKNVTGFTQEALRLLLDYCWPGNVRELENAVEHAFVIRQSGTIDLCDLPVEIRHDDLRERICHEQRVRQPLYAVPALAAPPPPVFPVRVRRRIEKEELLDALRATGWNKAETARRLGVSRVSVWRRMKALGIPPKAPETLSE